MKSLIFSTLLWLLSSLSFIASGQTNNRPTTGPGYYFNSFQKYGDKNPDSALFYVRKLASDPSYIKLLQELLHNSFAQAFQKMWEREITDSAEKEQNKKWTQTSHVILNAMITDSNQTLANTAMPIYFWTEVQKNYNDDKKLIELTNEFTATQLSADDLYNNRVGRYALLIYQVISEREALKEMSGKLFNTIASRLKTNQLKIITDTASRSILEKRAWYRYLYAFSNYVEANNLLNRGDIKEAGKHLRTAFDYSPDLIDNNNSTGYFYDMMFLLEKEKNTFQDNYVNYLTSYSTDKTLTLSTLLTMTLTNPAFKEQLRSFYNVNFPNDKKFDEYWIENINKTTKKAPIISLKKMDGSLFSSAAFKGKWILIDFWGTWCVPCRKEHPDLEKFYQDFKSSVPGKIELLTVACRDKEDRVTAYMSQHKYSFPVAMADNKIEDIFNINGYPSKILITPQGKYLLIPFGIDWVDFVKKYAGL
jgi:thiol-disulfide isomerase/thioredoxin